MKGKVEVDGEEKDGRCACGHQIVWHFDVPTVLVCERCETTATFQDEDCRNCGGPLILYERGEDQEPYGEE